MQGIRRPLVTAITNGRKEKRYRHYMAGREKCQMLNTAEQEVICRQYERYRSVNSAIDARQLTAKWAENTRGIPREETRRVIRNAELN